MRPAKAADLSERLALHDQVAAEIRRGRGITVSGAPERGAELQKAREPVVFARRLGYRPEELATTIRGLTWSTVGRRSPLRDVGT